MSAVAAATAAPIINPDSDGWCLYNAILAAFSSDRNAIQFPMPGAHTVRARRARKLAFLLAQMGLRDPAIRDEITRQITEDPTIREAIRDPTLRGANNETDEYGYPTKEMADISENYIMDSRPRKYVRTGENFLKGLYQLNTADIVDGPRIWGDYTILHPLIQQLAEKYNVGLRVRNPGNTRIDGAPANMGGTPTITIQKDVGAHFRLVADTPIPGDPIADLEKDVFGLERVGGAAGPNTPAIIASLSSAAATGVYTPAEIDTFRTSFVSANPGSAGTDLHTAASGLVGLVGDLARHMGTTAAPPPVVAAAAPPVVAAAAPAAPAPAATAATATPAATAATAAASKPGILSRLFATPPAGGVPTVVAASVTPSAAPTVVAPSAARVAPSAPSSAASVPNTAPKPITVAMITAAANAAITGQTISPKIRQEVIDGALAAAAEVGDNPYVRLITLLRSQTLFDPTTTQIYTAGAQTIVTLAAEVAQQVPKGVPASVKQLITNLAKIGSTLISDEDVRDVTAMVKVAFKNKIVPEEVDAKRMVVINRLTPLLTIPVGPPPSDWVDKMVPESDIIDDCTTAEFITPDCVAKAARLDAITADKYAKGMRVRDRNVATMSKYEADPLTSIATGAGPLTGQKVGRWLQLSDKYKDRTVRVRNPNTGRIESLTVSNPYRASRYREALVAAGGANSFASPAGGGEPPVALQATQHPEDAEMWEQNAMLLKRVVPTEMIADNKIAVALLESLWFCGSSADLASDPRCFPARILGELREYQATKTQAQRAALAKLAQSGWKGLKRSLGIFMDPFGEALPDLTPPAPTEEGEDAPGASLPALPPGFDMIKTYVDRRTNMLKLRIQELRDELAQRGPLPPPGPGPGPSPNPSPDPSPSPYPSPSSLSPTGSTGSTDTASPIKKIIPSARRLGVPTRLGLQPGVIGGILGRIPAPSSS